MSLPKVPILIPFPQAKGHTVNERTVSAYRRALAALDEAREALREAIENTPPEK